MHQLFEVAYLIAKKGKSFTDCHDLIELEKPHGVKFDVTYDNKNACADFIRHISQSLFDINVKSTLKRVNFITILCDGETDAAVIEKEGVFVLFVDPDDITLSLTFYSLKVAQVIKQVFAENHLSHLVFRTVFLQVMVPM